MNVYGEITGAITSSGTITGTLSSPETLVGKLTIPSAILPPIYEGETEITPSGEVQTLETESLYMTSNIIINPIPSNYGLITWNGSVITVS